MTPVPEKEKETARLEAFSDGVIAIIITIMVLEMKVPEGDAGIAALRPILPIFLSYLLSYVLVGIYWNNHHYLIRAARRVDAKVLWGNLHLLFWLSLVPFVTGWMGHHPDASWPTAVYSMVMLGAAAASFGRPRLADVLFVVVALIWVVPDPRLRRA